MEKKQRLICFGNTEEQNTDRTWELHRLCGEKSCKCHLAASTDQVSKYPFAAVQYVEMIENASGFYQLGDFELFEANADYSLITSCQSCSITEAIAAWTLWMIDQGNQVLELPCTERTRFWGRVFSVVPKDGTESRVFAVTGVEI